MNPLSKLLCAALLVAPTQDPGGDAPRPPFEALDFEAACAAASDSGRVLVVALVSPDSEDCRRLSETWSDDMVQRWIEVEAVAIEVAASERADLVERYAVGTLPTVLVLGADGLELDRIEGFFRPGLFVKVLKGALELRVQLTDLRRRLAESPEDPELHLDLARAYVSVKRLEPGVAAYDRAWRVGRGAPSFERKRTGLVLGELVGLTKKCPPAKKALIRWRREALDALSDPTSPGALVAAEELAAIYRWTSDLSAALELYEGLRARPEVPPAVLNALFDDRVASAYYSQERFEELAAGLGDVFVRTEELLAELAAWRLEEREGAVQPGDELVVGILAAGLYSKSAMYLDLLLRMERPEEARQLADLVLLREPYSASHAALMRAARKGGSAKLAREIADRGLATLQKKEQVKFRDLVAGFFKRRDG